MGKLQRPATLKEFVIQSLLGWRDTAATLVDRDDESPTLLHSRPDSDAPPARDTLTSHVFDLCVVPCVASSPSHPELLHDPELLRDTLPAPPPIVMAFQSPPAPVVRRPEARRAQRRATRRAAALAAAPAPGAAFARFVLVALVVLAVLASARS